MNNFPTTKDERRYLIWVCDSRETLAYNLISALKLAKDKYEVTVTYIEVHTNVDTRESFGGKFPGMTFGTSKSVMPGAIHLHVGGESGDGRSNLDLVP